MEPKETFPYHFNNHACETCRGRCCRGFGGYVWVSTRELEIMAGQRDLAVSLFAKRYLRQVNGRLSLQERVINGEHFCCFFDPITCQCGIYECRPKQCRTFPYWKQFKKDPEMLLLECPGVSLK